MAAPSEDGYKLVSDNRQARHQYEILETFEAGIELKGTEVKSIRAGNVNLRDGYALIRNAEIWLHNVHISPHSSTNKVYNHDPRRTRRLLLHRREISKLIGKVEQLPTPEPRASRLADGPLLHTHTLTNSSPRHHPHQQGRHEIVLRLDSLRLLTHHSCGPHGMRMSIHHARASSATAHTPTMPQTHHRIHQRGERE